MSLLLRSAWNVTNCATPLDPSVSLRKVRFYEFPESKWASKLKQHAFATHNCISTRIRIYIVEMAQIFKSPTQDCFPRFGTGGNSARLGKSVGHRVFQYCPGDHAGAFDQISKLQGPYAEHDIARVTQSFVCRTVSPLKRTQQPHLRQ